MRRTWVTLGIVALLLGAFVAFVPLLPVPSGQQTVGGGSGQVIAYFQVRSLFVPQYLQMPWTASTALTIYVADCGSQEPVGGVASSCVQNHTIAKQSGTSGTLSFAANNGDWIMTQTSGPNASVSLRTSNGVVGVVVLFLGGFLTLVGVCLRGEVKEGSARARRRSTLEEGSVEPTPETSGSGSPSEKNEVEGPSDQDEGADGTAEEAPGEEVPAAEGTS